MLSPDEYERRYWEDNGHGSRRLQNTASTETGNLNLRSSGGYVYRGRTAPSLRGRYVFGDYCGGRIWSVVLDSGRARGLRLERLPRLVGLTSFGEDASGELYVATMRRGAATAGAVFRVRALVSYGQTKTLSSLIVALLATVTCLPTKAPAAVV